MRPRHVLVLLVALCLYCLAPCHGMSPRRSPETSKVRVLYIGEPVGIGPYRFMEQDPFLSMFPVQATTAWYELEVIRRSLRMYLPRTYAQLTDSHDIIILSDANRDLFSGQMLKWFADGVTQDGMGLVMTGGRESFGAYFGMPDWTPTSVGDVLPVESTRNEKGPTATMDVLRPENRLIESLRFENIGRHGKFFGYNPVAARGGSETLAQLVPEVGGSNPFLVWWDIGEGRSFAMTSDWTPAAANEFLEWEFYPDYATNLMLFVADLEIPPNPMIVHQIRRTIEDYHLRRDFLLSMIEFVSRFGANPAEVEEDLRDADSKLDEIDGLYINYDFEPALALAQELVDQLEASAEVAIEMKDQALIWIYVIEWAAITGTSLVVGGVVWTLMVRKRLYREVGVTRSSEAS